MAPPPQQYQRDDKCLCFHHELLYEAKILDAKLEHGSYWYKVHYKGWKNTWDDWVPQERLRELNAENLDLAKMLKKEVENMNKSSRPSNKFEVAHKKRASSALFSESATPDPRIANKKRGRDIDTEKEEVFYSTPKIEINIPDPIKSLLVDDWENVTKNLMIPPAPHPVPAGSVLEDWEWFEKSRRVPGSPEYDQIDETVAGMKAYFNVAIGKTLLYTFERLNYRTVYLRTQKEGDELYGKDMVDVYGPEHLLRLLTQIPEFAATTSIDKASAARLKEEIYRLGVFLAKPNHQKKYFSTMYEGTSTAYRSRAP